MTLSRVQDRYRAVNGDHPMTPADDACVRAHFVEVPDPESTYVAMLAGQSRCRPTSSRTGRRWSPPTTSRRSSVSLRSVTPLSIRRRASLIAQAEEAMAVLEHAPRDPVARGSLGEATAELDALHLPMTDHDRLGLAGPTSREVWVDGPRRRFLDPVDPPLPLRTERLVLRAPEPGDVEALFSYYSDEQVSLYLLTPPLDRREAEAEIRRRVRRPEDGDRGSNLALVVEHDGRVVGDLVLMLQGPSWSQAEVGWVLHPRVAGRGIATEAARALVDLAFDHYGVHRVFALLSGGATTGPRASGPTPTSTPSSPRNGPPRDRAESKDTRGSARRACLPPRTPRGFVDG